MSFGIFVREFSESKFYQSNTNIFTPSKYLPFPMKETLFKSKKIKDDHYILCPLYSKGKNLKSDFQIGVTGTVEKDEEFIQTIKRECGEEIGLVCINVKEIKKYKWKRTYKDTVDFVMYETNIKDCETICESDSKISMNRDEDLIDKKVGCYIYGELKDILNFLNTEKIYRYKNEDDICGIVAIQVKIAKELIN
jgi:hypothetical protein